jgi:hypothetical protein
MHIHQPLEASPLVIRSVYAKIKKLPLRRQLVGGCPKKAGASSFVPQICYGGNISRRVLHHLPMELD